MFRGFPTISLCTAWGRVLLGDPVHRAAVDFCMLLSSFSIALTAQFTCSHLIFKQIDPDHVPSSAPWWGEASLLRWDNWETRRMLTGGEALSIWLVRLWSEGEGANAFPKGWRPVLAGLLNASPGKWGLRQPNRAIQGKGAGATKEDELCCDSTIQCLLIVPSDSAPNGGN